MKKAFGLSTSIPKGEVKKNCILALFDTNNPHLCFGARVASYLHALKAALPDIKKDDDLFHCSLKTGYGRAAMGKNYLSKTGRMLIMQNSNLRIQMAPLVTASEGLQLQKHPIVVQTHLR